MEFTKYYNVSDIVDQMQANEEIAGYPSGEDRFKGVYVCMDTNAFWVSRILKRYDEDYNQNENMYFVERNRISIYRVMDKLYDMFGKRPPAFKENDMDYEDKNKARAYLRKFPTKEIIKVVIFLDDEDGLSNWDCCEVDSLEGAIESIDGGFGILEIA